MMMNEAQVRSLMPAAHWQVVDVVFSTANTDNIIPHTLGDVQPGLDPTKVRFEVVDASVGGVVFRGVRAAQLGFIVLQATVAGTYRIRLFIETNNKL